MRLIFSTNNLNKMSEIKNILGEKYLPFLYSMSDLNIHINPNETGSTFAENAYIKANALYEYLKIKKMLKDSDYIIADDTGLCIDFLDGAPGIMSARFLGTETKQNEKNKKILELMKQVPNDERTAYFITNLSVIVVGKDLNNPQKLDFEGKVNGYIVRNIEKDGGFGYDPIFAVGSTSDIEKGCVKTYSNMGVENKNMISHRAIALSKFIEYLEIDHNI